MALSNIFREPRREITETIVGLFLTGGLLFLDYHFIAAPLERSAGLDEHGTHNLPWGIGMVLGAVVIVAASISLFAIHVLGEKICDSLADKGLELRPKWRVDGDGRKYIDSYERGYRNRKYFE